eukprot:1161819-Pelagomonas_calceolata.AAC.5
MQELNHLAARTHKSTSPARAHVPTALPTHRAPSVGDDACSAQGLQGDESGSLRRGLQLRAAHAIHGLQPRGQHLVWIYLNILGSRKCAEPR